MESAPKFKSFSNGIGNMRLGHVIFHTIAFPFPNQIGDVEKAEFGGALNLFVHDHLETHAPVAE